MPENATHEARESHLGISLQTTEAPPLTPTIIGRIRLLQKAEVLALSEPGNLAHQHRLKRLRRLLAPWATYAPESILRDIPATSGAIAARQAPQDVLLPPAHSIEALQETRPRSIPTPAPLGLDRVRAAVAAAFGVPQHPENAQLDEETAPRRRLAG